MSDDVSLLDAVGRGYDPLAKYQSPPRRKVFVSYHKADVAEVAAVKVLRLFAVCAPRLIHGDVPNSIIDSDDDDYIMRTIRETYIDRDSSVTLVLLGLDTWRRRYIDWEIRASLSTVGDTKPNGLIGIWLESTVGQYRVLPPRLELNLQPKDWTGVSYAQVYEMPSSPEQLRDWIELAVTAREIGGEWRDQKAQPVPLGGAIGVEQHDDVARRDPGAVVLERVGSCRAPSCVAAFGEPLQPSDPTQGGTPVKRCITTRHRRASQVGSSRCDPT